MVKIGIFESAAGTQGIYEKKVENLDPAQDLILDLDRDHLTGISHVSKETRLDLTSNSSSSTL